MSDKPHTPTEPAEVELLRVDRDLTRDELGQTLSELTSKLDVKARAGEQLHRTADTAREKVTNLGTVGQDNAMRVAQLARVRPIPVAAVLALLAALAAWLIARDRRHR
ncbi:DUF3618 domain-containing protein [Nocardia suismassiliense]|uniref:DUF3618 domain-containing protein n=1 Tax=Nocardia suismassiliense TaxID=2077092 RepID=A0ABW6R490_9NOCA